MNLKRRLFQQGSHKSIEVAKQGLLTSAYGDSGEAYLP
jgi:hypothetical protein